MIKYLLLSILLISQADASTTEFYYFNFQGCQWCPKAVEIFEKDDIRPLILDYDNNYSIDIKLNPNWKNYYKVKTVPLVLLVEVDGNKRKILYRWQLDNSFDRGKSKLKAALIKFKPKERVQQSIKIPFLKKLREIIKR